MKTIITKQGPVEIEDGTYYKLLSLYIMYRNLASIMLQIAYLLTGVHGLSWKTFYQESVDE